MPEVISWSENFSVGVDKIDKQHLVLIGMLNQLFNYTANPNQHEQRVATQNILDDMISYIDFHFKSEEELLKSHPDFEAHRFEHWEFVKKTMKFAKDFKEQKSDLSDDICDFLVGWLRYHILHSDIKCFRDIAKINCQTVNM